LVTTIGGIAGSGLAVAIIGDAARWRLVLGGVSAFVLAFMLLLAVGIAGNLRDELTLYVAYRASLRKALMRGRRIIEQHSRAYDGPEFQAWRADVIRRIERYVPEQVGRMGDGISGMGHDFDIVESLIAGITKWNIEPARIARGETSRGPSRWKMK
jgi:hypothetical protein